MTDERCTHPSPEFSALRSVWWCPTCGVDIATPTMSLVERAKALAYRAHEKQVRKGSGVSYITHPEAVVELLTGCPEATRAAGWLHDVVEDTTFTLKDIERECGVKVAAIVKEVTERKLDAKGNKRPWKDRKNEVIGAIPHLSQAAAEVRAADVISNFTTVLEDLDHIGEVIWKRFAVSRADSLWYYETAMTALIPRMKRVGLWFQLQGALAVCHSIIADKPRGPKR